MYRSDTMNEEIAVIIEQYADHARLPGMGLEWRAIGSTADAAINTIPNILDCLREQVRPIIIIELESPMTVLRALATGNLL